ncbi:tRNA pseudouridine(54/55) synthase Pus10 [Methanolapillus ohkumae]|uniref:tRNA pseudouridine synthase Pus10 n=1 Tax=Methanolapillus ohkumae TaxID=3028298 RepID=A0AA96V653_9EURY|nr:hypothetical protein MsAm2_04230 [Methanosarcinaceae archaeon Am2]
MADIFDISQKILAEGPICDHCLGRQFAKLSTGLSNDERGKAVKLVLAMEGSRVFQESGDSSLLENLACCESHAQKTLDAAEISNNDLSKSGKCWVCGDIFKKLEDWADMAIAKLSGIEYSTFLVGTKLSGLLSENEEILWEQCATAYAEQLKSELNREIGKVISQKTQKEVAFSNPDVMITFDIAKKDVEVDVRSVYIYGRYLKLVRGIPQTKWPCRKCGGRGCEHCGGTGKQYPESVGELAGFSLLSSDYAEANDVVFHGAGREDIDALMLGTGRPFVLEAKSPKKRKFDLAALEYEINRSVAGKIEVHGLKFCSKNQVEKLKGEKAQKTYRLKIRFESPVSNENLSQALLQLRGTEINQDTPNRVLHRRADLCRNRTVHEAVLEQMGDKNDGFGDGIKNIEEKEDAGTISRKIASESDVAYVRILCDGGLYVKELTSGDEGRTTPSIAGLLSVGAKVEELDVIHVELDVE